MTMKRILQCVLVSIVLCTVGCSLLSDSDSPEKKSNSGRDTKSDSPQTPPKFADLDAVIADVQNLNKTISESPDLTLQQATEALNKALTPLGRDDVDLKRKCTNCTAGMLSNLQTARDALVNAQKTLQKERGQEITAAAKGDIQSKLLSASQALIAVKSSIEGSSPTPTPS